MSDKVRLNYMLDMVIAVAFILSALSGLVFLGAGSGGYQGGRNPGFQTEIWGLSRSVWSDLHTWTSLVMIVGAVVHVLLHWNWIVCMTKRVLRPARRQRSEDPCPIA